MNPLRTASTFALIVSLGLSANPLRAAVPRADDPLPAQQAAGLRLLHGAIDLHYHMDPPAQAWVGGNMDNIRAARLLGIRALVFKEHGESTAGLAYQMGLEMPNMTFIGGVVLNRAVGGINLAAVERLVSLKGRPGRVVWLPTEDSAANLKANPGKQVVFLSKNGQLLPQVKELIAYMAKNDLVLATGHSAAEDALLVLKEGQAQGLKHMIATHPMDFAGKMTMEQMVQAAKYGALIELDFRWMIADGGVDVIKKVGPEHCVLSEFWTYLKWPPSDELYKPVEYGGLEGAGRFVKEMHERGITDADLDMMMKTNPARVLGLPVE